MSFVFDQSGKRKYLTTQERIAFLAAAEKGPPDVATFCAVLAYTGARVSEVLALVPARIDASADVIVFESLKKRRRGSDTSRRAAQHRAEVAWTCPSQYDSHLCRCTGTGGTESCISLLGSLSREARDAVSGSRQLGCDAKAVYCSSKGRFKSRAGFDWPRLATATGLLPGGADGSS